MSSVPKYKVKRVDFLQRRNVPIVMQNENGPCPLIAISNILLLRNIVHLHNDLSEISHDDLLSLIANQLFESNLSGEGKDEAFIQNRQQNVADAISMLPRLATGIDVNVCFRSIHDFEFTPETAIFDLFNINLVHGWLVDPQDEETESAIGPRSYNKLLEELVSLEEKYPKLASSLLRCTEPGPNSSQVVGESAAEGSLLTESKEAGTEEPSKKVPELVGSLVPEKAHKSSSFLEASTERGSASSEDKVPPTPGTSSGAEEKSNAESTIVNSVVDPGSTLVNSAVDQLGNGVEQSAGYEEALQNAVQLSLQGARLDVEGEEGEGQGEVSRKEGAAEGEESEEVQKGLLVLNFLNSTASQLTYHGLFSLQEGLKERELAVFFRNNHFSTVFKYEGSLYLLATDQGYFSEPNLVWEKLGEVEGNNQFFSGEMEMFHPNSIPNSWMQDHETAVATGLGGQTSSQAQAGLSDDLALAMALQQEEVEQQSAPRGLQRGQQVHPYGIRSAADLRTNQRRLTVGPGPTPMSLRERSKESKRGDCVMM